MKLEIFVWVNDNVLYKLEANRKPEAKPFLLRKSGNTLLVECRSADTAAGSLGDIGLSFHDAKSGAPLYGLVFDMEKPKHASRSYHPCQPAQMCHAQP